MMRVKNKPDKALADSRVEPVYVFDLDGVITDAHTSQINEEVVERMHKLLMSGMYVAVNTGRSYDWVDTVLITRLAAYGDAGIFSRFIAVCEKGGETVRWDNGEFSLTASEFALSKPAYDLAKQVFESCRDSSQSMFWDDTKRTMATLEKLPAANLNTFHEEQLVLVENLTKTLAGHEAKVDQTNISIDIESPTAGKYAGAKLIYEWVCRIDPDTSGSFVSIGDSVSDYEMARYFAERGAESIFVYVGKPRGMIEHHDGVMFVIPGEQHALGTLEFLDAQRGIF